MSRRPSAVRAEHHRRYPHPERGLDPCRREAGTLVLGEADPEAEREERARADEGRAERREPEEGIDLARTLLPHRRELEHSYDSAARKEAERAEQVEEEKEVRHGRGS